jgi:PAS domain S-box-containing protein
VPDHAAKAMQRHEDARGAGGADARGPCRQDEQFFRLLFERSPDGVFAVNASGRFVLANPACEAICGYSHAELLQKTFSELCAPDQLAQTVAAFHRNLSARTYLQIETALIRKDGRRVELWIAGEPLESDGAAVVYCTAKDITARKRADAALHRYELLAGHIRDIVLFMRHDDGRLLEVNAAALQAYGYSRAELLALTIHDLRAGETRALTPDQMAVAGAQGILFETVHRRKDGSTFPAEVSSQGAVIDGTATLISVVRDISERQRAERALRASEARLRLFVEHAPAALAMFDRQMRYVSVSRRWLSDYGLEGRDVCGQSHYEVFPDIPPRWREFHQRGLAGEVIGQAEDRFERSDGSVQWLHWEIRPWRDAGGDVAGIVIFTEDITARKATEAALRESHARLVKMLEVETVGVMFWDLTTGRMTDANDAFLRMMGYTRADIESGALTWQKLTPPEYFEISQAEVRKFMATGRVGPYEKEYFRRDGTRQWLLFAGSSLGNAQCIEFCVDVSERKKIEEALRESEERFRLAARAGRTMVYELSLDDARVTAAQGLADLLGYSPNEAELSLTWWDRQIHPDDLPMCHAAFAQKRAAPQDRVLQYRMRHKDGRLLWVEDYATPVRDAAGAVRRLVGTVMDITERKAAEAELERARHTLAEAQRIAHLGSFEYIAATQSTVWSEEEYRIYGLDPATPSPAYDVLLANCIHPDDATRLHHTFTEAIERGGIYELEHRIVRPDGSVRWVYDRAQPYFDAHRNLLRYVGATLDITERKAAEETVRRSEALLRAVTDHCPDAIYLKDRDGRLLFANPATLAIIGKPAADVLGRTDEEFYDHPADGRAIMANDLRIMAGGKVETLEESLSKPEGLRFYLATKAPFHDPHGQVVGLIGVARDITERRQAEAALRESEQRFRLMADGLAVMVWVRDAQCRLEFANRTFCEFFGVTPEEISAGRWHKPVHPEDQQAYFDGLLACAAEPRPFHAECRARRADGQWRWIESWGQPRFSAAGQFLGFVGASPDITERKEFEQQRAALLDSERAARSAAERAARTKDEFLATLSHELRTPLAAILGWSHLLRRGTLPPDEAAEALKTIEDNARLQKQLIEDLLDMGRVMSGKLKLDMQPVDVAMIIEEAVAMFRPEAASRELTLAVALDRRLGQVLGDSGRLKQVIGNLLSNALKFTPAGGRVRIRGVRRREQVIIAIKDSGIGIAPEFVPLLFERFRQADASTTRKYRGLGLGLALVKQLTELQHGTVQARSAGLGRGATFFIRLPALNAGPRVGYYAAAQRASEVTLTGIRALVVDDEPATRAMIARVLQEAGAEVAVHACAADAFAALQSERHGVLVSDISMPGEDGYTLLRKIRNLPDAERANIPAIALTAFSRLDDRSRAFEAGFQTHIVKPVDANELCAAVANLARRGRPAGITPGAPPTSSAEK